MSSGQSVTATFAAITTPQYQLAVQSAGTGTGAITSSPAGIDCGGTCSASFDSGTAITLTAVADANSTFAGWSGACTGTGKCTVNLTAATALTATFNTVVAPPLVLTVQMSGNGTGSVTSNPAGISCGTVCRATFASGNSVTLTPVASSGSTFAGWSGACTGSQACVVTLSTNASVTAIFNVAASQPTLTVTEPGAGTGTILSTPAGINCPTVCSASFAVGTQVALSQAVDTDSIFGGWSGACTGLGACVVNLKSDTTVGARFTSVPPPVQLTVVNTGAGNGTVSSDPDGISCGSICVNSFPSGTQVTLTASAATGSIFSAWSGACSGRGSCVLTLTSPAIATATFAAATGNIGLINHVILFAQENRSLDNYFGAMRQYWADNGIPDQSFDGLPQFNPMRGDSPTYGPPPSNPGCDPTQPYPLNDNCIVDTKVQVSSFHFKTVCNENTSPSWNESHVDWNYADQVGKHSAKNNGFVRTAAHDARTNPGGAFYDTEGIRAMGYWDGKDLNYDYFMATHFATSDRFFQPAMARTNINREYMTAATSGGYAYPNGTNDADTPQLKSTTIFQQMDKAGITWKVYVNPEGTGCTQPYQASCLIQKAYLENFTYAEHILLYTPQNIVPIGEYFSDLANGTLPQFAEIVPASDAALDEHGSDSDKHPQNVQAGSRYAASIINALMQTAGTVNDSWSDSALFFTYDESGGMYDHVSPQPAVSPDGIPPVDLPQDSVCHAVTGPICDFKWTGYRIPLIVVSPYAKKNYVSHTVADSSAILKFVETRFGLSPLTKRDAAQIDMTEFFDFNNPPWTVPPTPPSQNVSNPCYLDHLP